MKNQYELLTSEVNLQPLVQTNLKRILQTFDYTGNVYYRKERYYVEFILDTLFFDKDLFLYLKKAFRKVTNEFRVGITPDQKVIITMERYDKVFVSNYTDSGGSNIN